MRRLNFLLIGILHRQGRLFKIFNFEFWQKCRLYLDVWASGKLFVQLNVGFLLLYAFEIFLNLKKKKSRKIVTSLASNFPMQKSIFKIILGR